MKVNIVIGEYSLGVSILLLSTDWLISKQKRGVQKESQGESKIQKEIETVEVERIRGERRVC